MYKRLLTILLAVASLGCEEASAQYEWHHWVFGEDVHVRFPVVNGVSMMAVADVPVPISHIEGTATWSDPSTGRLELYCNGRGVYDPAGVRLRGAIGHSNGVSSTQSAQFVPHPKYSDSLYLFVSPDVSTTISTPNRNYSVVRLGRANSGQPWSIAGPPQYYPIAGSERLVATHSPNGKNYFVFGFAPPNDIMTWVIDENGLRTGVMTSGLLDTAAVYGPLKCSMNGRLLALVAPDIIVMDVHPTMGSVQQKGIITSMQLASALGEKAIDKIYGLSFSPSGRFLYVTVEFDHEDTTSTPEYDIIQYDLDLPTWSDVIASIKHVAHVQNSSLWPSALQLGPDSVIYMVGRHGLHAIIEPDLPAPACDFRFDAVPYAPSLGNSGLSSCIESTWLHRTKVLAPVITADDVCEGEDLNVTVSISGVHIDTLWTAPGLFAGERRGGSFFSVSTPAVGTYTITLELRAEFDTLRQSVAVTVYKKPVFVGSKTVHICGGDTTRFTILNDGPTRLLTPDFSVIESPTSFAAFPPVTTTYRFEAVNGPCIDTMLVVVQVTPRQQATLVEVELCGPDSLVLPTLPTPGRWSDGSFSYAYGEKIYVSKATTYLRGDATQACGIVDTLRVTTSTPLTVDAGDDVLLCEGEVVTLSMTGVGTPRWEPAALCDNPDAFATVVHPTETTLFIAHISAADCAAIDSVVVTVQPRERTVLQVVDSRTTPGLVAPITIHITKALANLRCRMILPADMLRPFDIDHAILDNISISAAENVVDFRLESTADADTVVIHAEAFLSQVQTSAITCVVLDTFDCRDIEHIAGVIVADLCAGPIRSVRIRQGAAVQVHQSGDYVEVSGTTSGEVLSVRLLSSIGVELGVAEWTSPGTHTARFYAPATGLMFVHVQGQTMNSVMGLMP